MIETISRTKKEWMMTAEQAKQLATELDYIAEEANDHQFAYQSTPVMDGPMGKFKTNHFVIIAIPDRKEKNDESQV